MGDQDQNGNGLLEVDNEAAVQPALVQAISVANYQVPPPDKFTFKAENWPRWARRFERFRKATGLDMKDSENQLNTRI